MDDPRYSELLFLREVAALRLTQVSAIDQDQARRVGLKFPLYGDLIVTLAEEMCIEFDNPTIQLLVKRLRGEVSDFTRGGFPLPDSKSYSLYDPRDGLDRELRSGNTHRVRVTYRGLRRLEELRGILKYDRILDHLGVLLDFRYLNQDLDDALARPADTPVSVLYADMDDFKPINDTFGHAAGDVVMKAYLEAVRDSIGSLGTAFRGNGDEVTAVIVGQGHARAVEVAERVRVAVSVLQSRYREQALPRITASIGVASSPPEQRGLELLTIAEGRNRSAKGQGKNKVVSG